MLTLRLHGLSGCAVPADARTGNVELLALGDFEAGNESAEVLPMNAAGRALSFPAATRAVTARVSGPGAFWGYGERRDEAALNVLLWPEAEACSLFRPDGADGYPGRHGGQALGYVAESGLLVAAGGNDALITDAIVGTLVFDTARGSVHAADTSETGVLGEPRAFATITRFGDELLIAGGETPVFGVPDRDLEPQGSAELFDAKLGRVRSERIELRSRRTHHAAVVLRDGRTLLVGGRSQSGGQSFAQYLPEIVDPKTRHADVTDSIIGRIDPQALLLDDGRVFVGGGVDIDGHPVEPAGEWIGTRAERDDTELSPSVSARFGQAFVATVGGGVLAVGGCVEREPASEEEAELCRARCSAGCPERDDSDRERYEAWWIAPDGSAEEVGMVGISAPRPILLPGSDGRPWLVAASSAEPQTPRLFRFDPWRARFTAEDAPAEVRLPRPGMPAPVAIDLDTFVWLDDDAQHGELLGLRLGTRNRYAQDVALVLQADLQDSARALHLAPDRPLRAAVAYAPAQLELRDASVTVHVTDVDYRDVTIDVHLAGGAPPVVLLGDRELGGTACPWPETTSSAEIARITREGPRAELRLGAAKTSCEVAEGRLHLALRAGKEPSIVTELAVKRLVPR